VQGHDRHITSLPHCDGRTHRCRFVSLKGACLLPTRIAPICLVSAQAVTLTELCAGMNHLNKLDKMLYLRQFKHLELVNLAGNPLCREANYRSYLCSHIKHLKFLDYCRVKAEDVTAAMEHHQDEMLDLKEKEDLQEEEERVLIASRQEAALMQDANLQGVDSFFDDLVKDDADWAKLAQVRHFVGARPCHE
jgi:hypothetical protein